MMRGVFCVCTCVFSQPPLNQFKPVHFSTSVGKLKSIMIYNSEGFSFVKQESNVFFLFLEICSYLLTVIPLGGILNGSTPPVEQLCRLNDSFYIQVMLPCKQQVNEGLTLHDPMERASSENACNQRKQGASALGFTLDQCSTMGNRNLDTGDATKYISLRDAIQLLHLDVFPIFTPKAVNRPLKHCCLSLTNQ